MALHNTFHMLLWDRLYPVLIKLDPFKIKYRKSTQKSYLALQGWTDIYPLANQGIKQCNKSTI